MKDAQSGKGKVLFLKASLETFQKDALNVMKENAFKGCFKERNEARILNYCLMKAFVMGS